MTAVANSIQAYGWRVPIVVDEQSVIVAGKTRYKAAKKLGLTHVPVHVATGLTPEQIKAYRIADNQTATLATWDDDRLTQELVELLASNFEMDLLGFPSEKLEELLGAEPTAGLTGGGFYIWGGDSNLGNYPAALKTTRLFFSQAIVWDKMHPVLSRKDFMGAHEISFYGWKEGAAHRFFGPNNVTDLWSVKKVAPQHMCHLTEKSVELASRAISYSSQRGENVLDLFGGSGSTLIAAEQARRKAFLMLIDPLYCDVICQRFAQFTGKKAERVQAA